jgi:hypothetical protein
MRWVPPCEIGSNKTLVQWSPVGLYMLQPLPPCALILVYTKSKLSVYEKCESGDDLLVACNIPCCINECNIYGSIIRYCFPLAIVVIIKGVCIFLYVLMVGILNVCEKLM